MQRQELIDTLASCKQQLAKRVVKQSPALEAQLDSSIKRTLHSIKGIYAMLGLPAIASVIHELESLQAQDRSYATYKHIGSCIQSLWLAETTETPIKEEELKKMSAAQSHDFNDDLGPIITLLELSDEQKSLLQKHEQDVLHDLVKKGNGIYKLVFKCQLEVASKMIDEISTQIAPDGCIISSIPTSSSTNEVLELIVLIGAPKQPTITLDQTNILCREMIRPDSIKSTAGQNAEFDNKPLAAEEKQTNNSQVNFNPNEAQIDDNKTLANRILNIPFTSIQQLIKQSAKLIRLIKKARKTTPVADAQKNHELEELMHTLDHNARKYHEALVKTRLNKAESLEPQLQQLVQALEKQTGKQCTLSIVGGQTLIDADILHDIEIMLVHMIKNAIDHGIESPTERKASGKVPSGSITLTFNASDDGIILTIKDDGKGIDFDALRAKGIEKKIITQDQAATVTHEQLLSFIFTPAFSTKSVATETSGRGIGMDVIKQLIEKHRGTIKIDTSAEQGTNFTITLPSNSVLVRLLRVTCDKKQFALPLGYVEHVFLCEQSHISTVHGKTIYSYEGTVLPAIFLHKIINPEWQIDPHAEYHALLIKHSEQLFILCVDQLLTHEETLIMPLGNETEAVYGNILAGHADFGDDMIVLVIHVSRLAELACHGETATTS